MVLMIIPEVVILLETYCRGHSWLYFVYCIKVRFKYLLGNLCLLLIITCIFVNNQSYG